MSECIEWQGNRRPDGYGRKQVNGKREYVHRLAYAEHHGLEMNDIREWMVLHSCDNPPCVNPDHLRLGTNADNIGDMVQRGRKKGERNCRAKLNEVAVRVIRHLAAEGRTQRDLAEVYGVSEATVSLLVARKTWGHI